MTTVVILGNDTVDPVILASGIGTPAIVSGADTTLFIGNDQGPQGFPAATGFGVFVPGQIRAPNQLLFRYESIGVTQIDLTRLRVSAGTLATGNTALGLLVAANVEAVAASVGSVSFNTTLHRGIAACSVTQLEDGEVLTIVGPSTLDPTLGDITIAFLLLP